MKNFRSFLIPLFLLLVSALVFSACRTKEPPVKPESFVGVELTYYKMFDDEDVMQPIIDEFIVDHPGLKINYRKFSDFREYREVILNELAEGEGPDIFSMQNTWFVSNNKKLAPMPESLGTPDDFARTFVDVAYEDLVRGDEQGVERVYGAPMTVDTLALYYNKDHFEDRIPEQGRPSVTWEGIKEDVGLLNKADNSFDRFEVSGIALGTGNNIARAVDILYLMFLQHDVEFYNEIISKATFAGSELGIADYPGVEALDLFVSFADEDEKHYSWNEFVVESDSEGEDLEAFASGRVSMILGYSFTRDQILDQIELLKQQGINTIDKDAIRVATVPQLVDPSVSQDKRVTYASYFAEAVSRNSEHPDLAWEFLIHVTSKDSLEHYFDELHKPTSRRDMIEDQKKDPNYGVFATQIGFAESFPVMDYHIYQDVFKAVIAAANSNGASRGVLVDAQDQINELLPIDGVLTPLTQAE